MLTPVGLSDWTVKRKLLKDSLYVLAIPSDTTPVNVATQAVLLHSLPVAATVKEHRLGCLHNRKVFSLLLAGQDQGVGRSGFPDACPLGLQMAAFPLCPQMVFPLALVSPFS